jgi:hypothetical protein
MRKLWIGILVVGLTLGLLAFTSWWIWKYPCLEYQNRPGACGGTSYCASWDSEQGMCTLWMYEDPYPCTVYECVRRGSR